MVNGLGQCVLGFVVILACSSFTNTLSEELNLAPDNIDIVNSPAVMGWKNLWNDPSGLSAICVAIFTALLYIVSRQQKALLEKSQKTAETALQISQLAIEENKKLTTLTLASVKVMEDANSLSRQSILTQHNASRGKLHFVRGVFDPYTMQCKYLFKNIGNGPVVIRGFASDYKDKWVPRGIPRSPNRSMKFTLISDQIVAPGRDAEFKDELNSLGHTGEAITEQSFDVEIEIAYLSHERKWRYHGTCIKLTDSNEIVKVPYDNWDFEDDITGQTFPTTEIITTERTVHLEVI